MRPEMDRELWPNFFVVGPGRTGSTSLYRYLQQHPQVFMSTPKEPCFFSPAMRRPPFAELVRPVTDSGAYQALFRDAAGYLAIGEASTAYFSDEAAAGLIRDHVPCARIIVLVRDPVERAHSNYLYWANRGVERRPFAEVIAKAVSAAASEWDRHFVEQGRYATHLQRYHSAFGRENVLVLFFADLRPRTREMLLEVADFLGVDREAMRRVDVSNIYNVTFAHRNRLGAVIMKGRWRLRSGKLSIPLPRPVKRFLRERFLVRRGARPEVDPRTVGVLRRVYEEEVSRLERLLDRRLPELRGTG